MKCSTETKKGLFKTMASVQDSVAQACQSYFQRFRRSTHVTPKSFLNFISSYKDVYTRKQEEIGDMSSRMDNGLVKLLEAAESVAELSKELTVMEKELEVANQRAERVLQEVTKKAKEAEVIKEQIVVDKNKAQAIVDNIEVERKAAETTLLAAKPALDDAENALNTIKQSNISTVRKLGRPPHLIMRVMDCTMILFQSKLPPYKPDYSLPCPKPSWPEALKVRVVHSCTLIGRDSVL